MRGEVHLLGAHRPESLEVTTRAILGIQVSVVLQEQVRNTRADATVHCSEGHYLVVANLEVGDSRVGAPVEVALGLEARSVHGDVHLSGGKLENNPILTSTFRASTVAITMSPCSSVNSLSLQWVFTNCLTASEQPPNR